MVDAVYRKITLRLIPFLFVCYIMAYIDRVSVGFARLQMEDDLGWSTTVYGIGAGMFFVGYILFEVPSNLAMHKVGARWWIARIMVTWGILAGLQALVATPTQFYVVRFLLGAAEAGFIPGVLLLLTYWYPTARRGRVTAYFLAAIPVATIVGGPVSGWILETFDGSAGYSGWQWMFVIHAVPTVLCGLLVLRLLPDGPEKARWLDESERQTVRDVLAADAADREAGHGSLRASLTSGRVWLLSGIYFTIALGIYMVSFWLPTIIADSGVESTTTIGLLSALPYLVALVAMIWWSSRSDRVGERRWHVLVPCVLAGVGLVATALSQGNTVLALVSLALAASGISAAQAVFWTVPGAFLSGIAAAAGIALINSIGNISGAVSTTLVGFLTDLTGSTASSLYSFGVVMVLGGLLVLLVPKTVNDGTVAATDEAAADVEPGR